MHLDSSRYLLFFLKLWNQYESYLFGRRSIYELVEQVVARIKDKTSTKEDKWIQTKMPWASLNITSKPPCKKLRDQGKIRFTQPQKKIILTTDSINEYLEKHARENILIMSDTKIRNRNLSKPIITVILSVSMNLN
ncbi:MAG: hypothetical protein IPJ79_01370 [Bacteroidetes bacterium]|nr:hypothetical protein [Bacteroidota bacterium]